MITEYNYLFNLALSPPLLLLLFFLVFFLSIISPPPPLTIEGIQKQVLECIYFIKIALGFPFPFLSGAVREKHSVGGRTEVWCRGGARRGSEGGMTRSWTLSSGGSTGFVRCVARPDECGVCCPPLLWRTCVLCALRWICRAGSSPSYRRVVCRVEYNTRSNRIRQATLRAAYRRLWSFIDFEFGPISLCWLYYVS